MKAVPGRRRGTVEWVDLSTPDLDRAIHFYEGLFGWHYAEHETSSGIYVVARTADGEVARLLAQSAEQLSSGLPPSWITSVATDHIDDVVAHARQLGGFVLRPPQSGPGGAVVALVADPAGAPVALTQSRPSGHEMVWGPPGAVARIACISGDPSATRSFYENLLGWAGDADADAAGEVVFTRDGQHLRGVMTAPDDRPPSAPSYWLVHFAVADAVESCSRATDLGGAVLEEIRTAQEARSAVLQDPSGAVFAVLEDAQITAAG